MITIESKGDFSKTFKFLDKLTKQDLQMKVLEKYGQQGVAALAAATPVDTGLTASSWSYDIKRTNDQITISWNNSNVKRGINIAIILQYGHATRNGGFVAGRDYINPAIRPIFDKMSSEAWEEVVKA